jgi:hypothetical protein
MTVPKGNHEESHSSWSVIEAALDVHEADENNRLTVSLFPTNKQGF